MMMWSGFGYDGDIGTVITFIIGIYHHDITIINQSVPPQPPSSNPSTSSSQSASRSGGYGQRGSMEGTYFSLDRQHPFTLEKRTDKLDTVYYVQPQRRGSWGYQRNKS